MLWLGAWQHQAITWAKVEPDLCRHIASLGHNELTVSEDCIYQATFPEPMLTVIYVNI